MKNEVLAHLHDLAVAAKAVKTFVGNHTFDHYTADEQLRSAVERKFEIMGEALNRIRRDAPSLLPRIGEHRDIISFGSRAQESGPPRSFGGQYRVICEAAAKEVYVLAVIHGTQLLPPEASREPKA